MDWKFYTAIATCMISCSMSDGISVLVENYKIIRYNRITLCLRLNKEKTFLQGWKGYDNSLNKLKERDCRHLYKNNFSTQET